MLARIMLLSASLVVAATGLSGCGLIHVEGENSAHSATAVHGHVFFRVRSAPSVPAPLSGRLLIFLRRGSGDDRVDTSDSKPETTWVAATEVHDLQPGGTVEVNADRIASPEGFSAIPTGNYEAQAVLDVDHNYNYSGRQPDDWISAVASLGAWTPDAGVEPILTLDQRPEKDLSASAGAMTMTARAKLNGAHEERFTSALLSGFWGHPVQIRAWVILPPGYSEKSRRPYPTAYWTHGFGGNLDSSLGNGMRIYDRMSNGQMPPMIWIMLDESIAQGTHEFADSVNNGPWGSALTTEFIPYLEGKYRMDARPSGRLLNGHSSGGWATLQLQVNYPRVFGGTWSTSPDPSDFHDFSGVDLYAPKANLYRRPDGSPVPIVRENGKVIATMEQLAQQEQVLGSYGGQLASFEWVFSPKGPDGAPLPMFDRTTGDVDPLIVAYWRDHYDLAHLVEVNWADRGDALKGRIHVYVGTADTFYLDGAARRFEAVLTRLGANAQFHFLPGRTHMNVYLLGNDDHGLLNQIGVEMYAVARPGEGWHKSQE